MIATAPSPQSRGTIDTVRGIFLLTSLSLALVACGGAGPVDQLPGRPLRIDSSPKPTYLRVEVADTPKAREHGLMGRTSLGADEGMAFLFDGPTEDTFWMKNTLIPLSIAFWDDRGRIVAILDMSPCTTDSCPTYRPDQPYVGAVEVNRGFFEEHGVRVGDTVALG